MKAVPFTVGLMLAVSAMADDREHSPGDPYLGEALFYAGQGRYFDALERLDVELLQHRGIDEPALDSLYVYVNDAEFAVGDFELSYRMHHRAGRAITAVLEGDVDEEVRNEAAFRLARIHFQKGQLEESLRALDRIEGSIPERVESDVEFLRANVLLATNRPSEAATTLRRLQGVESLAGFAAYNLGMAVLQDGRRRDALQQLDRAGQIRIVDDASRSIRDKANLVLGSLLMDDRRFVDAQAAFERVRLDGPMSNRALLNAGWADASADNFERAIVPWSILADREDTDVAVQEAKLALPFAYGQLEIHGRAALLYGEALESFDTQVNRLEESIASVRKGDFLEALIREEIRQDPDWIIRLRELPESPETYYLMELLASHDFQTALQNYLDMEDLRYRLESSQADFDAYEDIIDHRRAYYEPLLPEVDQTFRELDSRIRLRREQHALLSRRLENLLVSPRPEFLATTAERELAGQIVAVEAALEGDGRPEAVRLRERAARLRGVLIWTLETEYHERLTVFDSHLRELQAAIDTMTARYESFIRVRQAAVHSYEGYEIPIRRLRTRVSSALSGLELLMARQGHILELVAVDELTARRARLNEYRDQARYALADSYDRATKGQSVEVTDEATDETTDETESLENEQASLRGSAL